MGPFLVEAAAKMAVIKEAAKEVAGAEDVSLDFANDFSEGLEAEQEE